MIPTALLFVLLWCTIEAEDYYYAPENVTRTTVSGIQAYRSALTLDWLAAEDLRQREMVAAYETEAAVPARVITTDCISYPRPSPGKVARLMLELLKNLEGDNGKLVLELIHVLVRAKMLVETSMLDSEPNLDSLVQTPTMMMGEPHITFPRILAIVWMLVTDTTTTRNNGFCPIMKVNKYLMSTKPMDIAKHLRVLEPIVARARYIMEEFIQSVTPIDMYQKKNKVQNKHMSTVKVGKSEILINMPRSSGEQRQPPDNLTVESDYSSTPVLEQAQHVLSNLESEDSTQNKAAKILSYPKSFPSSPLVDLFAMEREEMSINKPSTYKLTKRQDEITEACTRIKPSPRDIVRRVYAIFPFFDKDHANADFLRKFRATVHGMSEGEDLLDREAALYASILTPLVFLQQYRDTWCLLERFHRAIRLYQISHPTEKRSALKLLQNFRAVNQKIRTFVLELPGRSAVTRTAPPIENDEEEINDKKDIRYLKELIKNLG